MQHRLTPVLIAAALLTVIAIAEPVQDLAGGQPVMFGKGQPASIEEIPPGRIRDRLESLPSEARARALQWLQRLEFPAADLDVLRIDDQGGVLYAEPTPPALPDDEPN